MNAHFSTDGIAPLDHLGLIRARGADAVKFLQGQLTNDVAGMGLSQARLAGFCSAKGRLQASFIVWKLAEDDLLLACAASVLPATLKRLSMFVMRAQCKLTDARAELTLLGATGASAAALAGDAPTWGVRAAAGGTLVRLPDVDGVMRALLAVAPADAPAAELPPDAWRLLEVRSGIPTIEAATVEQFVPQMLNFELIGGVDFQKGCYPGQEIVARSQYRGTIKRRMFLFECDALAQPGQEVFHSGDASQPAGMVANAAPRPGGVGSVALVEVKLAAVDSGSLHLASADGAPMQPLALPYPCRARRGVAGLMRELFVYYRLRAADADAAFALVRGFQTQLAEQQPGLVARLLRRPEAIDGLQTWMETYAVDPRHAPAGVSTELQAAIDARAVALLPLLEGVRHTEAFVASAS